MEEFQTIFPRPLFIINFRPEMLKFHPYYILTGDTRVEFVIYCVLSQKSVTRGTPGLFRNRLLPIFAISAHKYTITHNTPGHLVTIWELFA